MTFLTFRNRSPNLSDLSPEEKEVIDINQNIAKMGFIAFEKGWVQQLLSLFSSKEQIHLFFQIFCKQTNYLQTEKYKQSITAPSLVDELKSKSEYDIKSTRHRSRANFEIPKTKRQLKPKIRSRNLGLYSEGNIAFPNLGGDKLYSKRKSTALSPQTMDKLRSEYFECKRNNKKFEVKTFAEILKITRTSIYRYINKWEGELMYDNYLQNHLKYHRVNKTTEAHMFRLWTISVENILNRHPEYRDEQIRKQLQKEGFHSIPDILTLRKILYTIKAKRNSIRR